MSFIYTEKYAGEEHHADWHDPPYETGETAGR